MADREFSLDGYRALILALRDLGYSPSFLHEFQPADGSLISRHDVDISPADALSIARIEHELDWRSDFYFLLTSDLYNLASSRSRAILREISALGHTVGLHFDASLYGESETLHREQVSSHIQSEVATLQDIMGERVLSLSFHRPLKKFQGMPGLLMGLPHTYEPRFFSDVAYVSDSKGGWHYGHPLDHPAVIANQPLQLLTHPIWWTRENTSVVEKLESFITERSDVIRDELIANVTSYTKPSQPPRNVKA